MSELVAIANITYNSPTISCFDHDIFSKRLYEPTGGVVGFLRSPRSSGHVARTSLLFKTLFRSEEGRLNYLQISLEQYVLYFVHVHRFEILRH